VTIPSAGQLDLDSGIVKSSTQSDGDLDWLSLNQFPPAGVLTLRHHAYFVPGRGSDLFDSLTGQTLAAFPYSTNGLSLAIHQGQDNASVYALITKCGNYAKVLLKVIDNNLQVQFTTYIPNGGGACPSISKVLNNYTPLGVLQGGIAPGPFSCCGVQAE
jgi:hypothetical protein